MKKEEPALIPDYDKPVAYDVNGQPLYAHPPKHQNNSVHISRPIEPEKPIISDAVKEKHKKSLQLYPSVNLSEGEYIISAVKRHPIGLFIPMVISIGLIIVSLMALFNFGYIINSLQSSGNKVDPTAIMVLIVSFICFVAVIGYIYFYIYFNNKFFLTNESVIQEIQNGLFSKLEQTVSLANIEDASFTQLGIIQQVFNFGSIRLSTEGEETTYQFSYVARPKQHIDRLNNAIEAFKNGRPVSSDEN